MGRSPAGIGVNTTTNRRRTLAADSLARSILRSALRVSRPERLEALQLTVAALYPEEVPARRRDSAVVFLREFVRLSPDGTLPSIISWPGLDSLLEQVRRTTFAAFAHPRSDNALQGSGAAIPVAVVATRPARFALSLGAPGQARRSVAVDSAGPERDATLQLRLFAEDRLLVLAGDWVLTVTAVDSAAADTIVQRFPATVTASPFDLVPVPAALDSTQLRPEWAPPSRGVGIAIGAGLAGVTVLMAQAMRAPEPVSSATKSDARAFLVAGGFALGGVVGALKDEGRPIPANVAHNAAVRTDFAARVEAARGENDRRRAAYRATVTIGEPLP